MSLNSHIMKNLEMLSVKDHHIVCGYIRLNAPKPIAYDVIQLCLAYFVVAEAFDEEYKGDHIEISGIHHEICVSHLDTDDLANNYQTVLGKITVNKGIHHWRLQISAIPDEVCGYWRIVIGIVKMNDVTSGPSLSLQSLLNSHISQDKLSYGVVANNSGHTSCTTDLRTYGKLCHKVGDSVDMYLDLDSMELAYSMNDVHCGYCRSGIEKGEYRMALTLGAANIAMQLISYEQLTKPQLPIFDRQKQRNYVTELVD